jgi:hypothetical protein
VPARAPIRKNWGVAIQRCVNFLKANPNSSITWTKRDNNRVAHELAKWAEKEPNLDWHNTVPNCVMPYIRKDMGFVCPV